MQQRKVHAIIVTKRAIGKMFAEVRRTKQLPVYQLTFVAAELKKNTESSRKLLLRLVSMVQFVTGLSIQELLNAS